MAILEQLELNYSVFFHFVIFAIAYLSLSSLVFAPYSKALEERENRTKGGEDLAVELHKRASEIRTQYESKAREVNNSIKTIYDEYRNNASKEYEKLVSQARAHSQELIESARKRVTHEIADAQNKMKSDVPLIAQEMIHRLLAK